MGQNKPQQPEKRRQPSPALLERMLDNQQQELALRADELEFRKNVDSNQKDIAEQSIAAQLEDRERTRTHIERKTRQYLIAAGIIILMLLGFAVAAMDMGHADVVLKIAEVGIIFASGFVGGYGLKAARTPSDQSGQDGNS